MSEAPLPSHAPRSLLPREHGAWGQLALPLLAGLLLGRPTAAALLLSAAVVVAFTAHEPLLVVLGRRGRLREEDGPRVRRRLAALGVLATAAGAAGALLAPPPALIALGLAAALAAVVGALAWRRLEKTAAGEILVAASLSTAGGAVALAAGAGVHQALAASLAWVLSFAAATMGVRTVLVRLRTRGEEDPGTWNAAVAASAGALAFGLSAAGLPATLAWATLPGAVAGVVVALVPFSGRHLRAVGWSIVGTSVVTLAVLVVGLR